MNHRHHVIACFAFSLIFSAHAENIEHYDNKAGYRYFTDTKSGKEWREFKGTQGMSYEAILEELKRDEKFKGWRIASEQEVKELMLNTTEMSVSELDEQVVSGDERIIQLIRLFDGSSCNTTICIAGLVSDPAPACSHKSAAVDAQCRTFIKIEARLKDDQASWEKYFADKPVDGCNRKIIHDPSNSRQPCVMTFGDVLPNMSIDSVVWLRNGVFLVRP